MLASGPENLSAIQAKMGAERMKRNIPMISAQESGHKATQRRNRSQADLRVVDSWLSGFM